MSDAIKGELMSLATYMSMTSIKAKNSRGGDTEKDAECKTLVLCFDLVRVQLNEQYPRLSLWEKDEMKHWFTPLCSRAWGRSSKDDSSTVAMVVLLLLIPVL